MIFNKVFFLKFFLYNFLKIQSDLVFVCWGTLKGDNPLSNTNLHFWVMSFERNFNDIYFWEPMTNKKYILKNRVVYPDMLKKFFKGQYNSEEDIFNELRKKRKKKIDNLDDEKSIKFIYIIKKIFRGEKK